MTDIGNIIAKGAPIPADVLEVNDRMGLRSFRGRGGWHGSFGVHVNHNAACAESEAVLSGCYGPLVVVRVDWGYMESQVKLTLDRAEADLAEGDVHAHLILSELIAALRKLVA